jgi:hypothetical protein
MATETPQPVESESEMSRSTHVSSYRALAGTLQQCSHWLVHRETSNTATKTMTQRAHL